jgi:hypothetical protein
MTVTVPAIPTPVPQSTDTLNFDARADSLVAALPGVVQAQNLQNIENNEINANVNATAQTLAQITGSVAWVSGFNYAQGAAVYDPVNLLTYRRRLTGASATRPGLDSSPSGNWALIAGQLNPADGNAIFVVSGSVVDCSLGVYFVCSLASSVTFVFSAAPAGRAYGFTLEVNHTSGAITWPASVRWPENSAPGLVTGRTHLFMFTSDDGGAIWRGAAAPNYLAA